MDGVEVWSVGVYGVDDPLTVADGNVIDENSEVCESSQPVVVSYLVHDDVYEGVPDVEYEWDGVNERDAVYEGVLDSVYDSLSEDSS